MSAHDPKRTPGRFAQQAGRWPPIPAVTTIASAPRGEGLLHLAFNFRLKLAADVEHLWEGTQCRIVELVAGRAS